ncbi:Fic family protein [Holdemania sp. Marseille-P2844]|uniref:Fic family protein n=2 Tax=unclassified Holdemania TaxID=2637685 RepID=UPI00190E60C5|nr:Fic family protein [Holdemania sp. Marseille-P2844]
MVNLYAEKNGDYGMRIFDYSFLNNGLLPANLINLTSSIASLKTMAGMRKEEYTRIFTELEAIAKVQSVKSSNAIEGIVTSDERINAIVNQNSAPLNHNEAEIAGYRDALNTIHLGYDHMDFRQSDILRLHEMLMSIAGYEYGGQYKTDDNVILEVDAQGQRRVRFRPTPAAETSQAMEQLELAYLEARNDANINQLLLIPCVILDFLCIHPFRDGNGRMSRLLSLLLLYKNGYDAGKYVSFEEQINNYKAYYYEALRQSSEGWENNENSYFPFIENFLSTLYMCYKELDKRFAVVHGKKITKKARVEATVLNSLTPISKAEICRILPDVSPTTVEAVLGAMVKSGSIKRIGQARSARYIKAE